jgi:hypothetical protein
MTTMIVEVYDALRSSGADEAKARAAAEAISNALDPIRIIQSDLRLLKWMIGGIYLLGVPSLWLLLRVAAKVGALG